jgi:hypothetical protein
VNEDLDQRARALHAWFCTATGQEIVLRMTTLTAWIDWLLAGHNGPEMAKVIRYLRREVAAGRRNPGCLSLRQLLDVDSFEKDLGLALMHAAGGFDPDKKLSAPPDAVPAAAAPAPQRDPRQAIVCDHTASDAARALRIAELEELKQSLR